MIEDTGIVIVALLGVMILLAVALIITDNINLRRTAKLEERLRRLRIHNHRQQLYIVKFLGRMRDLAKNEPLSTSFSVLMDELSDEEKAFKG